MIAVLILLNVGMGVVQEGRIRDRARRFAKVGGEMVPLATGEELAAAP